MRAKRTIFRSRCVAARGLTLIELMLALTITVMVAGAMSGMMSAVTTGVMDRQDSRTNMVRSHAAESKLSAYIAPANAFWEASATTLAIWYQDTREGGTIHSTEVRWIFYDASKKTVEVHFIKFPENWTQTMKDLLDNDNPKSVSAAAVYAKWVTTGHMATFTLLDQVESFNVKLNKSTTLEATQVTFTMSFAGADGPFTVTVPATIAFHQQPVL